MLNKTLLKETKRILLYTLTIFVILSMAYLSISFIIQTNSDKLHKKNILSNEQRVVDVEKTIISNKISRLLSDILYISDSFKFSYNDNGDYSEITRQWLSFSNRKRVYDQIRFIDLNGNELIRVNYNLNGAYITKQEALQNINNSYYFRDSNSLSENQIYISKLDLSMDNNIIERPIKPVIRMATPYYDRNGNLKGIIILNYSANDILQQITKIASTSQGYIFMLNTDGYWLYNGEDRTKEWGFMYEKRGDDSFKNAFHKEWKTIRGHRQGSIISSNGVFNYTNILISSQFSIDNTNNSLALSQGDWYIVSYLSPHTPSGKLFTNSLLESLSIVIKNNYFAYALILLTSLLLAVLTVANRIEKDKVKYFSEFDTMTGVYNRRAGFEKLSHLYKNAGKKSCQISICFIDINGLKDVNDFFGHDSGDELIISVITGIKKSIREKDFVARLGGDEFLIIFEELDQDKAELIWDRILGEYINDTEDRDYIISVSHGIETFKCDSEENIDKVINLADEKMYQEKRRIKQNLKIIRERK